ncbi:general substrate transporter [Apodospora peruviana]|uniref:General substrate transporter n=1 Tax=Apodospora peruviana TaxID=516989 RepID=A0AAE0HZC4_9PEZI|nr:general substrate transporter [Apodospora peruviana]
MAPPSFLSAPLRMLTFDGDGLPSLRGAPLVGLVTSVCSAGFLLFGYDQGIMSGVILSPSWLATMNHPSELTIGTITALYDVGAVFGAILSAFASERLGRKRTLLLGSLLVFVGGILMAASQGRREFMAARVVVGIGIGYVTSVTPVYQSEIGAHEQRGWQVCCQLTTMLLGLLGAYCVNYGFYFHDGEAQWRFPLGFQCVFALYILVVGPLLPDTPRWLMRWHGTERGVKVLARLRGTATEDGETKREAKEIMDAIALESKEEGTFGWGGLFKSNAVSADKRFYLAVGIQLMQQLSGINIVTYFSPTLYTTALGMSPQKALLLGCFTQLWYVLASFVTWYTIDRVGRRKLFISMALGMCVVLVGEAIAIASGTAKGAVAAVVCLFLFEACFTWGWMACVWIYPPEILPLGIRGKGSALAAAADFVGNWIVVEVTPVGIAKMGWRFFLVWAGFNLVNAGVVWLFYPETGGLMLEAVDHVFTEELDAEESHGTGLERLQWARVRVAARAVKAARGRKSGADDESSRGLLDGVDTDDEPQPAAILP